MYECMDSWHSALLPSHGASTCLLKYMYGCMHSLTECHGHTHSNPLEVGTLYRVSGEAIMMEDFMPLQCQKGIPPILPDM